MQWIYPAEFRVAPPSGGADLQKELQKLQDTLAAVMERPEPQPALPASGADVELIVAIAMGVWRVRRAMLPLGTPMLSAKPADSMRKPFDRLLAVWDMLAENGIKIVDHTGSRYRTGMQLKAIFETSDDVTEETIVDTVKPSIYYRDQCVQIGEVAVESPAAQSAG